MELDQFIINNYKAESWEESLGVSYCVERFNRSVAQRKGASKIFTAHTSKRVAPAQFRTLDFAEREG